MKDTILNAALGAFTFAAILFAAFDSSSVTPQTAMTETTGVVIMEKTVVTASHLP